MKLSYQWILCYEDEIAEVEKIEQKVKPQLLSLLKEYIVIMDCTSATKPATIAYYKLAQQLWVPLFYFYEEKNQLKWLISKESVKEKSQEKPLPHNFFSIGTIGGFGHLIRIRILNAFRFFNYLIPRKLWNSMVLNPGFGIINEAAGI